MIEYFMPIKTRVVTTIENDNKLLQHNEIVLFKSRLKVLPSFFVLHTPDMMI